MDFRHAYFEMLNGKKVKRPDWGGFWEFDNSTILIHTFDFKMLDIRETQNVPYTFSHICEKDWEVCSAEFIEDYYRKWEDHNNKEIAPQVAA